MKFRLFPTTTTTTAAPLLVYQSITLMVLSITFIITSAHKLNAATTTFKSSSSSSNRKDLHPIVLIPGTGGNQLEARLNSDYNPSSLLCKLWHNKIRNDRTRDDEYVEDEDGWYRIWFDPTVVLAPFTKCFSERMMLYYDPVTDDYHNVPGVETRVPHFGSTKSLLYLDPSLKQTTAYMSPLISSLTSPKIGYIDGESLFGAPYDFRYGLSAPPHPSQTITTTYFHNLKSLIETATSTNNNNPVILITHSLGGLITLHFLLSQSLSWRQTHIKHFIPISTPWGGTVQEMLTFASGYTLGVPLVQPLLVREEQRSSESNLLLMPSPAVFGRSREIVVTAKGRGYSAGDIGRFLDDLSTGGFENGEVRYRERILPLVVDEMEHPGVDVTCVVGTGVKTPETLFYYGGGGGEKGFDDDEQPEIVYGDGDGTVNMVSLLAVEEWWGKNSSSSFEMIKVGNVSHTDLLKDKAAIQHVVGVVDRINSHLQHLVSDAR